MSRKSVFRIFSTLVLAIIVTFGLSQSNESEDFGLTTMNVNTNALNVCTGTNNVCDRVLIDRIFINSAGTLLISTSGVEANLSCSPTNNIYLKYKEHQKNYKEMYTMFLSAQLSGKRVTVKVLTGGQCEIDYAYMNRL